MAQLPKCGLAKGYEKLMRSRRHSYIGSLINIYANKFITPRKYIILKNIFKPIYADTSLWPYSLYECHMNGEDECHMNGEHECHLEPKYFGENNGVRTNITEQLKWQLRYSTLHADLQNGVYQWMVSIRAKEGL